MVYVRSKIAGDGDRPSGFENPLYGAGAGGEDQGQHSEVLAFPQQPDTATGYMDVCPEQDGDGVEDV